MIGDEVTITAPWVRGNQDHIGINAPKSVPVHREEIYERIKRERRRAAKEGELVRPVPSFAPPGAPQVNYFGPRSRNGGERS